MRTLGGVVVVSLLALGLGAPSANAGNGASTLGDQQSGSAADSGESLGDDAGGIPDASGVDGGADTPTTASPLPVAASLQKRVSESTGSATASAKTLRSYLKSRDKVRAKKRKTYRVTPSTKPTKKGYKNTNYRKSKGYNKYTKHYYMLRSYLERIEKNGGGVLVLKKGVYLVPGALYVPKNTTIRLEKGAVVRKTRVTHTAKVKVSNALFQTIRPSKGLKNGKSAKYRYSGYKGEKNITITGKPGSVIDLNNIAWAHGIVIGHAQRVTVKGISFIRANRAHYIELDASKQVVIDSNSFGPVGKDTCRCKEAVNLDTPDRIIGGFPFAWSAQDKTANDTVVVTRNGFNGTEVGVGTHNFSANKVGSSYVQIYHRRITVSGNTFTNIKGRYAVHVMQWDKATVANNTVDKVVQTSGIERGIVVDGSRDLLISKNVIMNVPRAIELRVTTTGANALFYGYSVNYVSEIDFSSWQTNIISKVDESFIRWATGVPGEDLKRRIAIPCVKSCGVPAKYKYVQTYIIPEPEPTPEPGGGTGGDAGAGTDTGTGSGGDTGGATGTSDGGSQ
ncbi:hypothetical protein [Rarobacter incanus]|nr:hypothetical protein [Rarobacter incanus]